MSEPRRSRSLMLAWGLVVLGVVYLVGAGGGGFFGLYVNSFRIASVAALAGALTVWLVVATRHPFWRPRSALWPAIAASLAGLGIATIASAQPRLGFDYLAYAALLAGAYLLLQRLFAHPFLGPRIGMLAVLLGFSLSVLYIAVVVVRWIEFWNVVGRIVRPPLRPGFEGLAYGNPSTIATAVILLWLAAAAHLGFGTVRNRLILGLLGLLTAAVVFLSGSRGAWVGLAISAALLVPAWVLPIARRRAVLKTLRSRSVRIGGAIAMTAVLVMALIFLPALVSRLSDPASDTRFAFYAAALRMFADDPLTGLGPGTWVAERIRFTQAPEADYYIPHAHNVFLQTAAELGVVGLLAGVVVTYLVIRLIRSGWRSDDPLDRRLAWAALAGVVYLSAHQLVDFYANMPAIGFLACLSVARLDARTPVAVPEVRASSGLRRLASPAAMGALAIATLAATTWLAASEAAALAGLRAAEAANAGDWARARVLSQSAAEADPGMPPYLYTYGLAAAHTGDFPAAVDALRRSAELDDFPTAWLNVARVELDLGNTGLARPALERAMRLGYQQPQIALGAALMYLELDEQQAAVSALADALVAAPGLAGDPFQYSSRDLQAAWSAAIVDALDAAPPAIGYHLALEAGRIGDASRIVAAMPEPDHDVAALVVEAWAGDRLAFDALHERALANPLDDELVAMCRRIAFHARDERGADPSTWRCEGAGAPAALIVTRVSPPPRGRVVLPGPNASWHFQYAYRRVAPFDELVPGLPHLSVTFV